MVKGDEVMIVLGADMHKRSHTIAAVSAMTGELVGEQTVLQHRRTRGRARSAARRPGRVAGRAA
jgi:hypothetical protein